MDNTQHYSLNTELDERVLWYDGDSSVSPERLLSFLLKGMSVENLYTTALTTEIEKYNKFSSKQITTKTGTRPFDFSWSFNSAYQHIDVEDFILEALEVEIQDMSEEQQKQRINRTVKELSLFKKQSLVNVLRLMIYIVDSFEQKNIVWGVGRGSSVSSYVLYLIGVHDVDSVKFDLPIEDFLRSN